jgi:hypothetical protein
MSIANDVLKLISSTYWKPNGKNGIDKQTIYKLIEYNTAPWTNSDYVYQIVVRSYSPGYDYLADFYDQLGYIDIKGKIHYGIGNIGQISNDGKTLKWEYGRADEWNKIEENVIPKPTADYYSEQSIREINKSDTDYLYGKMSKAYPSYSQFQGL